MSVSHVCRVEALSILLLEFYSEAFGKARVEHNGARLYSIWGIRSGRTSTPRLLETIRASARTPNPGSGCQEPRTYLVLRQMTL